MTTGYPSTMIIRLPMDRLIIRGVRTLRTCSGLRRMRTVSALPRKPIERMRNITIPYVRYQASCQLKMVPCSCSFELDMFLCREDVNCLCRSTLHLSQEQVFSYILCLINENEDV